MRADLRKLVLLSFLVAAAGCDKGFTTKPQAADLAGTYRLSEGSKTFLLRRKAYKRVPVSTISLGTNYSVAILNRVPSAMVCDRFESVG